MPQKLQREQLSEILIPPAREYAYLSENERKSQIERISGEIEKELKKQVAKLEEAGKDQEAERLKTRTEQDLNDLKDTLSCPMIENYARYFDGRQTGESPYVLLDYFGSDYLTIIDESHLTIPQIRAMHNTDQNRKRTLVEYG